VKVRAVTMRD